MTLPSFAEIGVGFELPPYCLPPISRAGLALYAGASGDHVPLHIDQDFARKAGMPDVFAHGMLSAAYLGSLLAAWVPQTQIRAFAVRFVAITHLQHVVTCHARVTEKYEEAGEYRVKLALSTVTQYGDTKVTGEAIIALAP